MLTVKEKTLIFLTAADLEDANKTHQTAHTGPHGPNRAAKPTTAQLGAVVALLNDADHKLSEARALIAEAFALLAQLADPD